MKEGLRLGISETVEIIVTSEMKPAFDEIVIHNVMSTVTMIYYMEKAGRHVILPYLEEDEEGAGYEIHVKHLAPAVVGQRVSFTASCIEITRNRVVCQVCAETEQGIIGKGTFVQAIFPRRTMEERIQLLEEKIKQNDS
ncbi:thioesterase family protein [Aneurinibacillus sp. REN35]|uniref:thioesterase family protein n=1 Tax=Aneurinibacillus sp. REN35 TaxID=3237286 RepID=UPI003527D1C4